MGGLLKPRWQRHTDDLEQSQEALKQTIESFRGEVALLQQEVASLRGRMRAVENSAAAAGNRCERVETRLGRLEARDLLPDTFERRSPSGAEDAEPPTKRKVCATCRGSGIVAWVMSDPQQTVSCTSCDGRGHIEVVPG